MTRRDRGRWNLVVVGVALAVSWLLVPAFAAAEDVKSAKRAVIAPVAFDDARLRGDLPAEEPFIDPASILEGKSSPRGEVLFRGRELVVEVYADDGFKLRVDAPFPHDEFIYILSGKLLLTDEAGEERKYAAGDLLMIPKGFTGIWQQSEDFRELVVIGREIYDATYPSD